MPKGTGGFLDPNKIIEELDITNGMKIADFGCGAGYFAILMAKIVGENGKIYALDVLKTSLEAVRNKAKAEGLLNIETIWSNLEILGGSKLGDESVDLVLLANLLFQSSKKSDIIKEAERVVKKHGKMAVIDWQKGQSAGPPDELIVSKDVVLDLAKRQGFGFKNEISAGSHHWGIIFVKS